MVKSTTVTVVGFIKKLSNYENGEPETIKIEHPADDDEYKLRGLWVANAPFDAVIERIILDDKHVLMHAVDASSFNAEPRSDGLPRHVEFEQPLRTLNRCSGPIRIIVQAQKWSTTIVGHVVLDRRRTKALWI